MSRPPESLLDSDGSKDSSHPHHNPQVDVDNPHPATADPPETKELPATAILAVRRPRRAMQTPTAAIVGDPRPPGPAEEAP